MSDPSVPRYNLSELEIANGESELSRIVQEQFGEKQDVYALWIDSRHPLSNVVRSIELQEYFDEIEDVMRDYEDQSMFLTLYDTRGERGRIAHIFRISGAGLDDEKGVIAQHERDANRTGIVLIDDIINSGQNFTAQDFYDYYDKIGLDVDRCISVETNLKRKAVETDKYNGLPLSQIGYISLFKLVEARGLAVGEAAVFAHLNSAAIISLQAVGMEYEPIAGRDDLKTPTVNKDGSTDFDEGYKPVAIPATTKNMQIFHDLSAFSAPQVYVKQ